MTSCFVGGCLCGELRYEANGEPVFAGYCCCDDCQKSSGSGFIPFMGFPAAALKVEGAASAYTLKHKDGREAVRNVCTACRSLVFGGIIGQDAFHTIYAGTLDDTAQFKPTMAINTRFKPDWVVLPSGLAQFEGMPPRV